jgi:uncharacterized membrane protein YhaH (DUF805 family)
MFKNAFSFEGRIRRTEFGISFIIYIILSVIVELLVEGESGGGILGWVLFVPMVWFIIAQSAKRCHDRGNSGWYQVIPFYVLWLLFGESENGVNEYGPNPKGEGA